MKSRPKLPFQSCNSYLIGSALHVLIFIHVCLAWTQQVYDCGASVLGIDYWQVSYRSGTEAGVLHSIDPGRNIVISQLNGFE